MSGRIAFLLVAAGCGAAPPGPSPAAAPAAVAPAPPPARPATAPRAESGASLLWAWLSDPSGLSVGETVIVAGLPAGTIAAIRRDGKGTRVELALRQDIAIWSDARLSKRATHVLGQFRLDLDPGTPSDEFDGPARLAPTRLTSGDEIADVVEDHSMESLMDHIDATLPGR